MESLSDATYVRKEKITNTRKIKDSKEKKSSHAEKMSKVEEKKEEDDDDEHLDLVHSEDEMEVDESEMKAFDTKAEKAKFKQSKHKYQVDTNIIQINLNTISNQPKISSGDPIKCKNCGAYLSKFSQVKPIEGKKEMQWTCEFCNIYNEILTELDQIPKEDNQTYILEKLKVEEKKNDKISSPIVVFCLDISGSMDRIDKTSKASNSRLDCVKLNIQSQLKNLKETMPNAQVGFVTFENKVLILGNTTTSSYFELDESSFDNFNNMIERCIGKSDLISSPIKDSYDRLITQLLGIKTGGATALGPGLTAAVALSSRGSPGSKVILCTDGKANRGIGKVESKDKKVMQISEEFYVKLGTFAKEKGIMVSLISIVSDDCKLEMLAPVANITGGDIVKVNPSMLDKDFQQMLNERIFATNVQVTVRLHRVLEFKNIIQGKLVDKLLIIDVGNAMESSKISFEYKFQSSKELAKMEIVLENLKEVYFQTTIVYMTPDNYKCLRVITMKHAIVQEKEKAEKNIKAEILRDHARFTTCGMAERGEYEEAMSHAVLWDKMGKGMGVKEEMGAMYGAISSCVTSAPVRGVSYKSEVNDEVTCMVNKSKKHK